MVKTTIPLVMDAEEGDIKIDNKAICVLDIAHHEIHQGDFFTTDYTKDTSSGGTANILLVVPTATEEVHIIYRVNTELEAEITMYEGSTVTGSPTELVIYNKNRNSIQTSRCRAYADANVTVNGTLLRTVHIGTQTAGTKVGGETRETDEWILKPGNYIFKVTNATTSANQVSIILNWYRITGDEDEE